MSETTGYGFGPYRLLPARRLLLRNDTTVPLTPKALDTLVALIERRDRVVTREELLNHLWPDLAVEEANLTQQVFLLRKVLEDSETGEQYIATVPRRGYRFVKDITLLPAVESANQHARDARLVKWIWPAAALLLLAAGGGWLISTGRIGDRADRLTPDPNLVVVLPFAYRGDPQHAYLQDAIMVLLARTLDGAGPLHTMDPAVVFAALSRLITKDGRGAGKAATNAVDALPPVTVARTLGAARYVSGDIVEVGGMLRIAARLSKVDRDGAPVSAGVEGPANAAVFDLVDDLTKKLVVGGEGAASLSKAAAATASLKALKEFVEGERLFFSKANGSPQAPAYEAFDRAVEADPGFAVAWYRLSQSAYFSGQALSKVSEYAESEVQNRGPLRLRERRMFEAYTDDARGMARESQLAYEEILRTYPYDVEALFGLGLLGGEYRWLVGGPPSQYKPRVVTLLRYLPNHLQAVQMLRDFEAEDWNCAAVDSLNRRMSPKGVAPLNRAIAVFCGPPSRAQEVLLRSPGD